MKKGLVICGPDVARGALALLSGTFEQKVQKAARLGCDGIELMVRDPAGLDWPAVKGTLAAAGLQVPQVVTGELYGMDGLCLVTADAVLAQRTEQRFQSVIDLAAFLGAMVNMGRVRGRLDLLAKVDPKAECIPLAESPLQRECRPLQRDRDNGWEIAFERGVRITMEPLNRYESDFILTTEEGLRFVDAVGLPNLGLMLDLFHMNIEEAHIEDALCQAGDRLWHVHVADSNRRYPGAGHTDFDRPFAALKAMEYRSFVSAELLPLPDPDTAAEKTMAHLRRYDD